MSRELNPPGLELMRGFDVVDRLGRVGCPMLIGVGELDPVTPVAAAREIVDALPGEARLEVIEGGRALSWKDAPAATGRRFSSSARPWRGRADRVQAAIGERVSGVPVTAAGPCGGVGRVATLGCLAASAREIGE